MPQSPTNRAVKLEGMHNMRDIGGLGKLHPGVVFRCDDPLKATPADKQRIKALGIRTVCDLRTDLEADAKGHESFGAKWLLCDLPPNAKKVAKTIGAKVQMGYAKGPAGMAEANELLLDVGKASIARALRAIAAPGGVPVILHCTSGKDRTGLVVMLLLSFLGVDEEEIVSDYALTEKMLPRPPDAVERAKQVFTRFTGKSVTDAEAENVLAAHPESARLTLAMFHRVHGGVDKYFRRELGFTDSELTSLRRALTSPPPKPPPPRISGAWYALGAVGAMFGLYTAAQKEEEPKQVKAKPSPKAKL
eukprot:Hpha_TRINITY_DN17280_c0_g1::TRINITY_DN17280_c0_g1_i1::g.17807::m.17807